jgi:hypothetical protein
MGERGGGRGGAVIDSRAFTEICGRIDDKQQQQQQQQQRRLQPQHERGIRGGKGRRTSHFLPHFLPHFPLTHIPLPHPPR